MESLWYLVRLGFDESKIPLNIGETHIGRSAKANILVESVFSSRSHCVIIIDENNKIKLRDKETVNGTFVNSIVCKGIEKRLRLNDKIGIGCTGEYFDDDKYYVYKLMKEGCENESDDSAKTVKLENVEKEEEEELVDLISDDEEAEIIEIVDNKQKSLKIYDDEDSNDFLFSQSIISEYKTDAISHDDELLNISAIENTDNVTDDYKLINIKNDEQVDDIVFLSSDEDEAEEEEKKVNNWLHKLSQNVDLENKSFSKVTIKIENIENNEYIENSKNIENVENIENEENVENVERTENGENLERIENDDNVENEENKENDVDMECDIKPCFVALKDYKISNDLEQIDKTDEKLNNEYQPIVKTNKIRRKRLRILSDTSSDEDDNNEILLAKQRDKLKDTLKNYNLFGSSEELSDYEPVKRKLISNKEIKTIKLIEPVHFPTKKKVPSSSIDSSKVKKVTEVDIIKRVKQKEKNRLINIDLKHKWREKPKYKTANKEHLSSIVKNRKLKLKEIASAKIKTISNDEPKIINKPKVKLTMQNRGAFLTEAISIEPKKLKATEQLKPNKDLIVGGMRILSTKDIKLPKIPKLTKEKSLSESNSVINEEPSTSSASTSKIKRISHEHTPMISSTPTILSSNNSIIDIPSPSIIPPLLTKHTIPNMDNIKTAIASPPLTLVPPLILKKLTNTNTDKTTPITNLPITSEVNSINLKPLTSSTKTNKYEYYTILKSILKKCPSNKVKKTVRFKLQPAIKIFQVEDGKYLRKIDENNILPKKLTQFVKRKMSINKDPNKHLGQNVLTQILSWNPMWLYEKNDYEPPVNGEKHTILPIIHAFKSIQDYQRIFLPLQKLEIWSQIYVDFHKNQRQKYSGVLKQCHSVPRGNGYRNIYTCFVTIDRTRDKNLTPGNLILVEYIHLGHMNIFFGYITDSRFLINNKKTIYVTFESAQINTTENIETDIKIKITIISYVRVDVSSLNTLFDIQESPLCNLILNPTIEPPKEVKIHKYRYKGSDYLNKMQGNILMHVYNESLNRSKPSVVLINGPPGTGKSCLISNLALQLLYGDEIKDLNLKILICSGSNQAIDIITEKLLNARKGGNKFKLLRFGLLEKMNKAVQTVSLQKLVLRNQEQEKEKAIQNIPNAEIEHNLRLMKDEKLYLEEMIRTLKTNGRQSNIQFNEIHSYEEKLNRITTIINNNGNVRNIQMDDRKTSTKLMQNAEIVCTTLTSCINMMSCYNLAFDICIIDEATQCTEPICLLPIQFQISTLVLVGDTQQLPANVISKTAKENGFCTSLFTRIKKCFIGSVHNPLKSLTTQYRMHPDICHFPNKYFYNNELITDNSTIDPKFNLNPYTVINLNCFQDFSNDPSNISNKIEAEFIVHLLVELTNNVNCIQYSFGVITPYNAQKRIMQNIITELNNPILLNININTIDSYQGQERDVIILTTTRTDGVGFLGHNQRLNVALTRAKRCLIICGNFISLRQQPMWSSLLQDATERNCFHNVNYIKSETVKTVLQWIKK